MDLRQLRSFVHVAELGSISAAASRLNTAQSALSRQMLLLEEDLGAKLFVRHGRGVVLTEKGKALLGRATTILHELDHARQEARQDEALLGGLAVIGVPPTVGDVLSGSLADSFLAHYPNVKLRIVEGYSGHILDWLQRGLVDIAILYQGAQQRTVKVTPLIVEQLMAISRPGELAPGAGVPFSSLADKRLILPSPQHGLRILLDTFALRSGFEISAVAETDSLRLQIDLVKRGHGMTILPLVSVFREIEAGTLVAAPIIEPEVSRRLVLALPSDRRLTGAALRLEALVKKEVARLVSSGRWNAVLLMDNKAGAMPRRP